MMKKIYYNHISSYFYLLLLLFIVGSCSNHEEPPINNDIVEGQPAIIKLGLNVADNSVQSRSSALPEEEARVRNIYILIFNRNGVRDGGEYFATSQDSYTIQTLSGVDKKIYAIANLGLGVDVTSAILDGIDNLKQLQELKFALTTQVLERGGNFVMSGIVTTDDVNPTPIDIPANNAAYTIPDKIRLRRIDAKVTFNISLPKEGDGDGTLGVTNLKFDATGWRVVNSSAGDFLINRSERHDIHDTFDTEWTSLEGLEGTELYRKTFTFYTLENKAKPIVEIPSGGDAVAQYKLRAKKLKDAGGAYTDKANPVFKYANPQSTYVQIKGNVEYTKDKKTFMADVVYSVHLGYENSDANDYNTDRNTHYTYTMTVKSVEDIILEAESTTVGDEPDSGADGTVHSTINNFIFDSHYDQKVITFNIKDLTGKLGWYINTPFEENTYKLEESGTRSNTANSPKDYKWVYFKLNGKLAQGVAVTDATYDTKLQKYPGAENIYNVVKYDKDTHESIAKYYETILKKYIVDKENDSENEKLLDIYSLVHIINALGKTTNEKYKEALFNVDDDIVFTIFVNENYYEKNPLNESGNTWEGTSNWKKFANKPHRTLSIFSGIHVSLDEDSSFLDAVMTFTQKSIQTVYSTDDTNNNSLTTAWGTESDREEEDGRLLFDSRAQDGTEIKANDASDGLENTKILMGMREGNSTDGNFKVLEWDKFMWYSSYTMVDEMKYASQACMTRNRDLNGDGKINENEVRWYLAAREQLSELWIGERSISNEASLYDMSVANHTPSAANGNWEDEIYASSTVKPNNVVPYLNADVILSAEGASSSYISDIQANKDKELSFRCVRNLGTTENNVPEKLITFDKSTSEFDMSKLDYRSIRTNKSTTELPAHYERSIVNLPFLKFEMQDENVAGLGKTWLEHHELILAGKSLCPNGWRVPNQREATIMAVYAQSLFTNGDGNTKNKLIATEFSLNLNKDGTRPVSKHYPCFGLRYTGNEGQASVRITGSFETDYIIRCVKDI